MIILMVFSAHALAADKRILFVGNSYTFFNDMPQRLLKMLNTGSGDRYYADLILRGGAKLADYQREGLVTAALSARKFDFVILQEQSSTIFYTNERAVSAAAYTNLIAQARQNGARVLVVDTWARKAGNAFYAGQYSNFINPRDPKGMTTLLYTFCKTIAEQNNATLVPVGAYWWIILDGNPGIELYIQDGSHPTQNGSYLYATLLYREITGQLPGEAQISLWGVGKDYADLVNKTISQH